MTGTEQSYGRYTLIRKIAKGGMAEIFEARMDGPGGFDKRVALKRLHANLAADDLFIKMLADEARITARLSHPNICQIFDFGVEGDGWFLAMELIEGCDLGNFVRRARKLGIGLPVEGAVWIAREAAEGLAYAHALCDGAGRPFEVVHRDVSPQNILVSAHGEVKVCDFGIAKATARMARTEAGVLKGKFCYMSPEHARGEPLDGRADVFSLAIVLFELVSGVPLYPQVFTREVLEQVRQGAYPPLAKLCPTLPAGLQRILSQALLPSRAARIDARRFADALADLARREGHGFDRTRLGRMVAKVLPELGRSEADDGVATQMWSGSDRLRSADLEPISEIDATPIPSATIAATPPSLRRLPEQDRRSGPPRVPSDARVPPAARGAQKPPDGATGGRGSGRGWLVAAAVVVAGSIAGVGFALHLPPPAPAPSPAPPVPLAGAPEALDGGSSAEPGLPDGGGRAARRPRNRPPHSEDPARSFPGSRLGGETAATDREGPQEQAPSGALGSIRITAVPTGTAFVDGRRAGRTPLTVRVTPGRHNVVVESADGRSARRTIIVGGGTTESAHLNLE
ncbi:MAG: serine/threonine protein kinase [Deltaproteobacteria bacterium]|nr:serine/threonine protein kinase [Deltaproteobacteria bacterium]